MNHAQSEVVSLLMELLQLFQAQTAIKILIQIMLVVLSKRVRNIVQTQLLELCMNHAHQEVVILLTELPQLYQVQIAIKILIQSMLDHQLKRNIVQTLSMEFYMNHAQSEVVILLMAPLLLYQAQIATKILIHIMLVFSKLEANIVKTLLLELCMNHAQMKLLVTPQLMEPQLLYQVKTAMKIRF